MPEPSSTDDDSLIIVCGPPNLKAEVSKIIKEELGWNNSFEFN
jgi:hypothetical protein